MQVFLKQQNNTNIVIDNYSYKYQEIYFVIQQNIVPIYGRTVAVDQCCKYSGM